MPLLSINTLIFQGHDIRTALRELAQLGVARVELAFIKAYAPDLTDDFFTEEQGRRFRDLLDEFGLTGPAVSAHMDLGADDAVEAFRRRMVFAQALGASYIISNASSRQREMRFYRNMEELADGARSMEITICLENPGDGDDHLIDAARTGAVVIREIGSAHVRLNYDIGNVFINTHGAQRPPFSPIP
jgi:sugar phosphate isomerase/epimerase